MSKILIKKPRNEGIESFLDMIEFSLFEQLA